MEGNFLQMLYNLSQNQFHHSTNIIGLLIKLGKYVSLHREGE